MGRARSPRIFCRSRAATSLLAWALAAAAGVAVAGEKDARLDPLYALVFGGGLSSPASMTSAPPIATAVDTPTLAVRSRKHTAQDGEMAANEFSSYRSGEEQRARDTAVSDAMRFQPDAVSVAAPGVQLIHGTDSRAQVWSADLYGTRTLAHAPQGRLRMLAGVKVGGVDGDSASGIGEDTLPGVSSALDTAGIVRTSASSDTLFGPLVGIAGDSSSERQSIRGILQQSLLVGKIDTVYRERFDGNADQGPGSLQRLAEGRDVNVPVTDLGIKYVYDVADNVSFGLGAFASVWWDAPVASGDALSGGETLVFMGGMGSIEARF